MRQLANFFIRRITKNNFFFKYYLDQFTEQKFWTRKMLNEKQNELFVKLIHRAYNNSPFYQKLYDEHGLNIDSIKDTRDANILPAITKEDVKKNVESIWIGNRFLKKKGYTSGTSGSPLVVYRNFNSIIQEEAYIWRQRINFGHRYGMKAVSLRGDLNRDQFKSFDPFSNTLYLSSFMLSKHNAEKYYEVLRKFNPNAIYAYPSSVEILANFLVNNNRSLHIPFIFTSSETLYDFQREKIEKAFNARVVDWYGNAERTIALEENQNGTYSELPLYSFNEYFADYTLSTGFINTDFPLIKYRVDDILEIDNRQSGIVRKIIGRSDDVVFLSDGTQIGRLGGVFKGINEIQYAQIIQNEIINLSVNIVPGGGFNNSVIERVDKNIRLRVGNEIDIKYQIIKEDDLIKTKRGKYRLVINMLDSTESKKLEVE